MSHVDDLISDLRAMATGVDQAQSKAAAVDARVHEVAAQAARAGFAGIAAGMVPVREAVGQVRAKLNSLKGSISDAAGVVTAVPKESSPEETIVVLGKAGKQVETVRAEAAAAVAKVEETKKLVAVVLRGGQPGPLLSALDGVKEVLDVIAGRCGMARQHLETAARAARQVGEAGN